MEVENSLAVVVKHRDVLVGVVKFLALLPLMDCRVGCHQKKCTSRRLGDLAHG